MCEKSITRPKIASEHASARICATSIELKACALIRRSRIRIDLYRAGKGDSCFLISGGRVTPAQGGVEPTVGSTTIKCFPPLPPARHLPVPLTFTLTVGCFGSQLVITSVSRAVPFAVGTN